MKLLILFLLLTGCGKVTHKIQGVPKNVQADVNLNDGFADIHQFCDDRYGAKSTESEVCIQDALEYRKLKIGFDLDSIEEFCSNREDEEGCLEDIVDSLDDLIGGNNGKFKDD